MPKSSKITHPECETFYKTVSPACLKKKGGGGGGGEQRRKTGLNEVKTGQRDNMYLERILV